MAFNQASIMGYHKISCTPESIVDKALVEVIRQNKGSSFEVVPSQSSAFERVSLTREQRLRGKKILFLCCGRDGVDSKRFVFARAAVLGIRVILVEKPDNPLAFTLERDGLVETYLPVDMTPRASLVDEVLRAVKPVELVIGGFDGALTFWDDSVGLAARVIEALGLPGNSVMSVDLSHNKNATRETLRAAGIPSPKSRLIKTEADVMEAGMDVGMPLVMKPMYGAASLGVFKVERADNIMPTYKKISKILEHSYIINELMGLTFDGSEHVGEKHPALSWLVMEEYLDGDEVDVDIVMNEGKVTYGVVNDDWPPIMPWFAEMGNNCPSKLPAFKQQELLKMAEDVVIALRFRTGVLHLEFKYTSKGPRLIEVNPRMGGGPLWRMHKVAFNVDLIFEELCSACGIPSIPAVPSMPFNFTSCSEKFFERSIIIPDEFPMIIKAIGTLPNVIEATCLLTPGTEAVGIEEGMPTRTARFIVVAHSAIKAESYAQKLLQICDILISS